MPSDGEEIDQMEHEDEVHQHVRRYYQLTHTYTRSGGVCVAMCCVMYVCVCMYVCMFVCHGRGQTQVDAPSIDTLVNVATQSAPDIDNKVCMYVCYVCMYVCYVCVLKKWMTASVL